MGKVSKLLIPFIILCLFSLGANGAVKPKGKKKKRISITKVQKELKKQVRQMDRLKKKVDKLESSLGKSNKKYLSVIKSKKEVENSIYDVRDFLERNKQKLEESYQKANDALTGVVVNSLDDGEDPSVLLSNKILAKILKKRLFKLKTQMNKNASLEKRLIKLEDQYILFSQTEKQLAEVVSRLEAQKSKIATKYSNTAKKKDKIQVYYDKLKAKRYLRRHKKLVKKAKSLNIAFNAPINSYTNMTYKKNKGVSFYFKEMQAVTAPAKGKVVFQGTVGSFGKIVFIDHGNDLRSVILGNYFPKVSKGMFVSKGDVLGYTERLGDKTGEIYYELRKKNKALNTITYVDKNSLSGKRF